MHSKIISYGVLILAVSMLAACLAGITIGGTVTGLTGSGLVLNYIADTIPPPGDGPLILVNESLGINGNGNFTFKNQFPVLATRYFVNVANDPSGQFCILSKNSWSLVAPTASVTDISVQCASGVEFQLLAGGSRGSADGTGAAAKFSMPGGIALDSAGNTYLADTANHTIRRISPVGVVTTLAGMAGSSGSADGTGANARFNNPRGIAVDSAGNVYVADYGNGIIRKISNAGLVTTLAGMAGSLGNADGIGATARFLYPSGIAVDSAGNAYVTDGGNSTVRKISPAGVVTTLIDGTGGRYAFFTYFSPGGIAIDGLDNAYLVDSGNGFIYKISPAGGITTLVGSNAQGLRLLDGIVADAQFVSLSGDITIDSVGNVYVVDDVYLRKISPAGMVSTIGKVGQRGTSGARGLAVSSDKFFITSVDLNDASQDTVLWAPKP